jgi:hypothetical protein
MLNKLLDDIGIEEKIYDWSWTTATFGDLFVEPMVEPDLGVIAVNDELHPIAVSRIDHNGTLVGFYKTPQGATNSTSEANTSEILPPWNFVHFRLLGAKRRRAQYGNPNYSEFRSIYLMMGQDTRQSSSRYGTSVLLHGLPAYKRLRMAEDSLLMARTSKGILRYVWKLKMDSSQSEGAASLVDMYAQILKRARAMNTTEGSLNYEDRYNPMTSLEDIFVPIFTDDVGDLTKDEIGGNPDIRWIVDIDEFRNQCAAAVRCPLSLLGSHIQEASGSLGSEAIEKLDIRFARSARRVQRALKNGITRICQIHLAMKGFDPDPALFECHLGETSTAEEESIKNSLDTAVDVVDRIVNMVDNIDPGIDKLQLSSYLFRKIVKMDDFELSDFKTTGLKENIGDVCRHALKTMTFRRKTYLDNTDVQSFLPTTKKGWVRDANLWESKYSTTRVLDGPIDILNENKDEEHI